MKRLLTLFSLLLVAMLLAAQTSATVDGIKYILDGTTAAVTYPNDTEPGTSTYTGDIYAQRQLRLMITLTGNGTPIGTIDFMNFDPLNNRAELGLFVSQDYRGKGLGRQALELLTSYARDHIGLRQLYVFIAMDNEACLNLFKDFGYQQVGILKSWVKRGMAYRDVVLMQMIFN